MNKSKKIRNFDIIVFDHNDDMVDHFTCDEDFLHMIQSEWFKKYCEEEDPLKEMGLCK